MPKTSFVVMTSCSHGGHEPDFRIRYELYKGMSGKVHDFNRGMKANSKVSHVNVDILSLLCI